MRQIVCDWLDKQKDTVSEKHLELMRRAADTLENNIYEGECPWFPYRCITPFRDSGNRGIWNWDTAFHAATASRWEPQLGQECLEGFMNFQGSNGMFPDVIWSDGRSQLNFGKPPLLASSVEKVYRRSGDKLFLRRAYTRLVSFEKFFCEKRKFLGLFFYDADPVIPEKYDLHVRYESGWDNSVRWDDPCVNFWAIDLNCFAVMMYRSLAYIAGELHEEADAENWRRKEKELSALIEEKFWSDEVGAYVDVNRFNGKASRVLSPASFMPLYIGIASKDRADRMNALASDPRKFYPGMPTVAYDDPEYGHGYWRGTTWLNVAYFAAKGLKNYGYPVADTIRDTILGWVEQNPDAIYENYDSKTGRGTNARHFGWSSAFVIELILNF